MVGRKEAHRSKRIRTYGAYFWFCLNWEKEESDASPFQTINAVEEAVSEKVHGGAMPESPELAATTKERIVSQRKRSRTKRGKRGSHLREETGEKGTARRKSCGGHRRRSSATSQSSRELRDSEEEKMRGGAVQRGFGPLQPERRERERGCGRGGVRLDGSRERERSRAAVGGGDEPDGWAPPINC